jgi:hypothetical protein
MINRYITLDHQKYAITTGTYIRKWMRSFTTSLVASIVRLNFVDRGPGIRVYSMTLSLANWSVGSKPYNDGITLAAEQQMANLEASYAKIATSLQFYDVFGNPPSASSGVYFTNMNQIVPNYATVNKSYIQVEIELTESTQVAA